MVKLHGKKYRIILCLSCLIFILLSISACAFRSEKRYQLVLDEKKKVSWVCGTSLECICVVFGDNELVIYTYKGEELLRKRFDKRITYIQTHLNCILLTYEDDSMEMYQWSGESLDCVISQQFSASIKKAELLDWGTKLDGVVVLLDNGDLYRSDSYETVGEIVLVDHRVKTATYYALGDYLLYITMNDEIKTWCFSETFHINISVSKTVLHDVKELQVTNFILNKEYIEFIGIGNEKKYYFASNLDNLYICEINDESIKHIGITVGGLPTAIIYQKDGDILYQGPSGRKHQSYRYSNPYKIKVESGYSLMPINGGVVYYNENEVNVLIVP